MQWVIAEAPLRKGGWTGVFGNANPVHLEIGCGKGRFILTQARQNPDINFIALERESRVLLCALESCGGQEQSAGRIRNLVFVRHDAGKLTECFAPGELSRIYLNFSDPWPKHKHAPRRLTHRGYLRMYQELLDEQGAVFIKTDNRPLFDFTLSELAECGYTVQNVTYDLHAENMPNVETEYEMRFAVQGYPIHRVEAHKY